MGFFDYKCRVVIYFMCSWGLVGIDIIYYAFFKRFRCVFFRRVGENVWLDGRIYFVLVDND